MSMLLSYFQVYYPSVGTHQLNNTKLMVFRWQKTASIKGFIR
jgi:hypothetical protein